MLRWYTVISGVLPADVIFPNTALRQITDFFAFTDSSTSCPGQELESCQGLLQVNVFKNISKLNDGFVETCPVLQSGGGSLKPGALDLTELCFQMWRKRVAKE